MTVIFDEEKQEKRLEEFKKKYQDEKERNEKYQKDLVEVSSKMQSQTNPNYSEIKKFLFYFIGSWFNLFKA